MSEDPWAYSSRVFFIVSNRAYVSSVTLIPVGMLIPMCTGVWIIFILFYICLVVIPRL